MTFPTAAAMTTWRSSFRGRLGAGISRPPPFALARARRRRLPLRLRILLLSQTGCMERGEVTEATVFVVKLPPRATACRRGPWLVDAGHHRQWIARAGRIQPRVAEGEGSLRRPRSHQLQRGPPDALPFAPARLLPAGAIARSTSHNRHRLGTDLHQPIREPSGQHAPQDSVSAVADDHEVHLGSPRLLAQYLRGRTAENPRLDRNSAAPQGARDLAEHPGVALLLFLLPGRDLHFQLRGAERFVEMHHRRENDPAAGRLREIGREASCFAGFR